MKQEIKLCINCKYFVAGSLPSLSKCHREPTISLVDGSDSSPYCSTERESTSPIKCTAEGQFFEEKANV